MTDVPSDLSSVPDVRSWLAMRTAFYLRLPAERIDPNAPLAEYGMNSLYAVSLLADVEDTFGIEVESMAPWSHPTLNDLARYLVGLFDQQPTGG